MQDIVINGRSIRNTWNMLLEKEPEITPPEPQTYYVKIPGMDGTLDLTDKLYGGVRYKDRKIKIDLISLADRREWESIATAMMEDLHGKTTKIVMSSDPGFFYVGRITFEKVEYGRHVLKMRLSAMVSPYKVSLDGKVRKL